MVGVAEAKVLRGMAFAALVVLVRLGPPAVEVPTRTEAGAVIKPEAEVYFTEEVSAFEPADCEADCEKEVVAPAPVAFADAFD